jgi:hypothetical protein
MSLAIHTIVGLRWKPNPAYSRDEARFNICRNRKESQMFGFGKKPKVPFDPARSLAEARRIDARLRVQRQFSGRIPRSGALICDLGFEVSRRVTDTFSSPVFYQGLVSAIGIQSEFPIGWTAGDALSRYYALGLICLTHCSMQPVWSDALTIEAGMQVHDAALELMWTWANWIVPGPVAENTLRFMRDNIADITGSLRELVDERARRIWFSRYVARLVRGGNPAWRWVYWRAFPEKWNSAEPHVKLAPLKHSKPDSTAIYSCFSRDTSDAEIRCVRGFKPNIVIVI